MRIRAGCGGADRWLRFLVEQEHKRNAKRLEELRAELLGPKPGSLMW